MTASWTIDSVKDALAAKKISARELAGEFFKRMAARNAELNVYLTISEERAYKQADRVDALIARGKPLPPLAGVPIAIKDVISTRGIRTTAISQRPHAIAPVDTPPIGRERPAAKSQDRLRGVTVRSAL